MQDKTKTLYEKIKEFKPQFESNEEALKFFSLKMQEISIKLNTPIDQLILKAEISRTHDEELMKVLSLASKVKILKSLVSKGRL